MFLNSYQQVGEIGILDLSIQRLSLYNIGFLYPNELPCQTRLLHHDLK